MLISHFWKKSLRNLRAEVEKRLAGSAPKKGLGQNKTITKEDFMKMSYSELLELKEADPETYDAFVNSR